MSEFALILDIVASVVSFVFNKSLDLFCTVLLLVSCVAVWNWTYIAEEINSTDKYREKCVKMFAISVLDFILMPFLLLILLSPMRWSLVKFRFRRSEAVEHRIELFALSFCSVLDAVAYFFYAVSVLSPFGRISTIQKSKQYFFGAGVGVDFHDRSKMMNKYSKYVIKNGMATILDILVMVFLLPFLLITPSIWGLTMRGVGLWCNAHNQPRVTPAARSYASEWLEWYANLRMFLFNQVIHSVVDLMHFPCFVLVCISPLRRPLFWNVYRRECEEIDRSNRLGAYDTERSVLSTFLGHYEFNYSTELRSECATLAALALADLFLLPMLLPLWVTRYRYHALCGRLWPSSPVQPPHISPVNRQNNETAVNHDDGVTVGTPGEISVDTIVQVKGDVPDSNENRSETSAAAQKDIMKSENCELSKAAWDVGANQDAEIIPDANQESGTAGTISGDVENTMWGLEEFSLIAAQTGLLITDAVFLLIPLPILFLTQYRWAPVQRTLQTPNVFLDCTSSIYLEVLTQLALLMLDILCAPLLMIVMFTWYRSLPIRKMLSRVDIFQREKARFHKAIVMNFAYVFHDLIFMAPAVAILPCCLVAYRAPIVFLTIKNHMKVCALLDSRAEILDRLPKIEIYPHGSLRKYLWCQVGYSLLDIPTGLLFVIIVVTQWRAAELFSNMRYAAPRSQFNYITLSDYSTNYQIEYGLRRAVYKQFLYLCRDLLYVVPMLLIIGTVYRLPSLVIQFISSLWSGGAALSTDPVMEVVSCHITFPVRGGPQVNFSLRKRQLRAEAHRPVTAPPGEIDVNTVLILETGEQVVLRDDDPAPVRGGDNHLWVKQWDNTAKVELHVIADEVWEQAARVLGKFLVSLVRGYLPLKLVDGKDIGWSEFVNESSAADLLSEETMEATSLWMRLDFGTTKRTTILKKLALMPPTAIIVLQLEGFAITSSSSDATTGTTASRRKVVIARVRPTVQELVAILQGTSTGGVASAESVQTSDSVAGELPIRALSYRTELAMETGSNVPRLDPRKSREGNFVNSFHITVQQVFLELLMDVAVFLMVFFTIISPLRFVRMLVALLEREDALVGRICANTLRSVHHLDSHLLEYRKQTAGPLNKYFKEKISEMLRAAAERSTSQRSYLGRRRFEQNPFMYSFVDYLNDDLAEDIKRIEKYHLHSYQSLCKSSIKALSFFAGCEKMEELVNARLELHQEIVRLWYLRTAASLQYRNLRIHCSPQDVAQNPLIDHSRFELVQLVLAEEHDKVAQRLQINENKMKELTAQYTSVNSSPPTGEIETSLQRNKFSLRKGLKRCFFGCGLLSRPLADSRKLVFLMFMQALTDVGFMLLLMLLLISLVRTLPLLSELYNNNTWSPLRYSTKWILIKHVKLLVQDLKHIGAFAVYTMAILVTVGRIPKFLADVPYHLTTYYSAAKCAKYHAKKVFSSIMALLSLLTAFRTYRIALKASVYCTIIPAACLAEAFPIHLLPPEIRFTFGMLEWVGLLVGAIFVSVHAASHEEETSTENFTTYSRSALLGWCGAMFGMLFVSALSVSRRSCYVKSDCSAVRSPQFTWDHLLAVLTGPIESIQLSAVVLYFFWEYTRTGGGTAFIGGSDQATITTLGADTFAAVLMVWAPSPMSDGQFNNRITSSSDGSSTSAFRNTVMVAVLFVICWALLLAAPIATSAAESARRREKVMAFKNSPVYEFCMIALSRLLCVWIMATLMRATSCVHVNSQSSTIGYAVVSTAQNVNCGDNDSWAAVSSLALLAFYMITSSILHADDADLLDSNVSLSHQKGVKFSPLYALCVRAAQFFVCAACFGGFQAKSSLSPLLPILCIVLFIAALPTFMRFITIKSSQASDVEEIISVRGQVCSVATVTISRSAGFLSVAWTTIVCMVRSQGGNSGIFASERTVYVGWGVIYAIAAVWAYLEDRNIRLLWERRVKDSGLAAATEHLMRVISTATANEAVHGRRLRGPKVPSDNEEVPEAMLTTSVNTAKGSAIELFGQEVLKARSYNQVAKLLLTIEQDILSERLTSAFLAQRQVWLDGVKQIASSVSYDEEVSAGLDNAALLSPADERTSASSTAGIQHQSLQLEGNRQQRRPSYDDLDPLGTASRVGFAFDQNLISQLLELGFPLNRAQAAAVATHNAVVDNAVAWLIEYPNAVYSPDLDNSSQSLQPLQGPLSDAEQSLHMPSISEIGNDIESGFSSTESVCEREQLGLSRLTPTSTINAVKVTSPAARRLLSSIAALERGITSDPLTSNISRKVFSIFMTRKVPLEVCWLIFSYFMSSAEIKSVLLNRDFETPTELIHRSIGKNAPVLRQRGASKTHEYLYYSSHYLWCRQQAIANARVENDENGISDI